MGITAHETYGPDRTAAFGYQGPQIGSKGFAAHRPVPKCRVDVPDSFASIPEADLKGLTPEQVAMVRRAEAERERLARFLRARNAEYDAENARHAPEATSAGSEPSDGKSVAEKAIAGRRSRRARGMVDDDGRGLRPARTVGEAAMAGAVRRACEAASSSGPALLDAFGSLHQERGPPRSG